MQLNCTDKLKRKNIYYPYIELQLDEHNIVMSYSLVYKGFKTNECLQKNGNMFITLLNIYYCSFVCHHLVNVMNESVSTII